MEQKYSEDSVSAHADVALRAQSSELQRAELLDALKRSEEMHVQMLGYLQSIANGELGPHDVAAYLKSRIHESYAVSCHARAAIKRTEVQGWAVTVEINGDSVLTISNQHLAGISEIDEYADIVRGAADHLRAFIGERGES